MIYKIKKETMFNSTKGWLQSRFHFSFAEYKDFNNTNFGNLRVLNDDIIKPLSGFDMHPHRDMEIVTYIIDGELTHQDSMGHKESLKRGEVQYMSAGTGVYHSEYNMHGSKDLRLLQIWIIPPNKNLEPSYGSYRFTKEDRINKLLNIVSDQNGEAKIKLYQDVSFFVSELDKDKTIEYKIKKDRAIYFVQIEGKSEINGEVLKYGDALKIVDESSLTIKALEDSHFLFIDLNKL